MKKKIETYRNIPGIHCGTTAMRNLLFHYCALELREETTFGLGSGIDSIFIKSLRLEPAAIIFGRSITMEVDVANAFGIDYREQPEIDNRKAWQVVRQEVLEGRPTMLTGDIFFLDYRNFTVRFPAHRFVLLGFDDEEQIAFLADRVDPEPQSCSYEALSQSRNPDSGLSTLNLWGKFYDTRISRSVEEATAVALKKAIDRMLGRDLSQAELLQSVSGGNTEIATGIEGANRFGADLSFWSDREDAAPLAKYAADCIEKFGTGGGNFRKMYAVFLEWAQGVVPDIVDSAIVKLANRSAQTWSLLAAILEKASQDCASKEIWKQATVKTGEIVAAETELFETLDGNLT